MFIPLKQGQILDFKSFDPLVDGVAELTGTYDLQDRKRELRNRELRVDAGRIKVAKKTMGAPSAMAIEAQTSAYRVLEASFTGTLRDRNGKVLSAEGRELMELLRIDAERKSVGQVTKRALLSQVSALRAALQVITHVKDACNLDDTRPVLSVFLQACKLLRDKEQIELDDLKNAAMALRKDEKASVVLVYATARAKGERKRRKDAAALAVPPSRENSAEADAKKAPSRTLPLDDLLLHEGRGPHIRLDDLPPVEELQGRDFETSHAPKQGE